MITPAEVEEELKLAQRQSSRLLHSWRRSIDSLARRWEIAGREPTVEQVRDVLAVLEPLIDAGVFDASKVISEADRFEVEMLYKGVERLRAVAERVVEDEEAERLRSTFAVIEGQRTAG